MSARVVLLGVPIDPVTGEGAIDRMLRMLQEPRQYHVATPNNEMLVEAARNPEFHHVLCAAALNLPDSTGLLLAARYTGQHIPERVTGIDTVESFCMKLTQDDPVFLLGGASGVAEAAAEILQQRNPRLRIAGTLGGSPRDEDFSTIRRRIAEAQPHVLFVAFGSPLQDLWIARHLGELPSVRLAMGVGGTFDVLAGRVRRAPGFLRALGLEWLWRLLLQPWRIKRIWNAVVVFPWMVFLSTLSRNKGRGVG